MNVSVIAQAASLVECIILQMRASNMVSGRQAFKKELTQSGVEWIACEIKMKPIGDKYAAYLRCYFETLDEMGKAASINDSPPILKTMRRRIDGHFDETELQLLKVTLDRCRRGCLKKSL